MENEVVRKKIITVIKSCENLDQLNTALDFLKLANEMKMVKPSSYAFFYGVINGLKFAMLKK